jgi:putative intracellular protease/amidase
MSGYGIPGGPPQQIIMLAYPGMTALDLIGPNQVLSAMGNVEVHLVGKTRAPQTTDSGVVLTPTKTFSNCPENPLVLFVPGGARGTLAAMKDDATLAFLAESGKRAKYVTSVCTGSLLLAAAGLLKGYKATTHWAVHDTLKGFGAIPTKGRVVTDRNRITGAGVTAGLDFALTLVSKLRSEKMARAIALGFEYDPAPPFKNGSPELSEPSVLAVRS